MTHYVPVGIDHGTTNSSIAVMDGSAPRVLTPRGNDAVMPSAVYLQRDGRQLVGSSAIQAMLRGGDDAGDGYTGYKPRIGQDDRYEFRAAKTVMTAPELGAVVLKELLNAYRETYPNLEPKACVITVPAKFGQADIEGTRRAAELSGLLFAPTLQEPIAAAIAYGLARSEGREQWLVFDLGGGTLDVTLVAKKEQEAPMVLAHEGDNFLGGRHFDRALFSLVLGELSKRYVLRNFTDENPRYARAWKLLMLAVEIAKIELSSKTEAVVEVRGEFCKDDEGREVQVEVPITRARYEKLIGPEVERAVHVCQRLLHNQRLRPTDISRVLLIGGPTKTPYIQDVLRERLRIALDASIDPMTAVAQGAAIQASTLEIPREVLAQCILAGVSAPTNLQVRLEYERVSTLPSCAVGGVVEPAAPGMYLEIRSALWSSGRVPIGPDGTFFTELTLQQEGRPVQSCFKTSIYDAGGRRLSELEEPRVWFPPPGTDARLANSLRVGVAGGMTHVLVRQGETLPFRSQAEKFATVKPLKRGDGSDVLAIPIFEGITHLFGEEDARVDSNEMVGALLIRGDDSKVTRDLPAGSDVEVTLTEDGSRTLQATAYVQLLNDEFSVVFRKEGRKVDPEAVKKRVAELEQDLERIRTLNREEPLPAVTKCLVELERLDVFATLRIDLERALKGEKEAAHRAERRCLELVGSLWFIRDRQRRVAAEKRMKSLRPQVNDEERQDLRAMEEVFASASDQDLIKVESSLQDLEYRVRGRPYFDVVVDLMATSKLRVDTAQAEVFNRSYEFVNKLDARGGSEAATEADLTELRGLHEAFVKKYPDLAELRAKVMASIRESGGSIQDVRRSDVRKVV